MIRLERETCIIHGNRITGWHLPDNDCIVWLYKYYGERHDDYDDQIAYMRVRTEKYKIQAHQPKRTIHTS